MAIRRAALIYDDTVRPETTGMYCRRALEGLVEVEHFRPEEISAIPRQGFDLYVNVDDGLRYRFPRELRPSACWMIDTHMDFAWYRTKGTDFDFAFAAQHDGATQLREEGVIDAHWLPLACDPGIHRKHDVPKQFDVCFVGNVTPGPRASLLRLIQEHYPSTFIGQCYFEEMAKTYSVSRIVFNRSVKNDVNMRVFEALAAGSLLLTNDLSENGLEELFQDGVHLGTYLDPEELLNKIAWYLAHEEVRERIATAGRQAAVENHTYRHRMEQLLQRVETSLSRTTTRVASIPSGDFRDRSYFEFSRPEILAMIPQSARKVLDIGCGSGWLGSTVKARQPVEVVGIEMDEQAARLAKERLDEVRVGDVEQLEPDFPQGSFDCIVCADVLEHLRDPGSLLRRARAWLSPDGRLIASIPNVRHYGIVTSLLAGNWTYEPAGLLDATHLRFSTRHDAQELFESSGFTIAQIKAVPGPGYEDWQRRGGPGDLCLGRVTISGLPKEEAQEFYVYQYLIAAVPTREIAIDQRPESKPISRPFANRAARVVAVDSPFPDHGDENTDGDVQKSEAIRKLSVLYVGDFRSPGKSEQYAAAALRSLGHRVDTLHDADIAAAGQLVETLNGGEYDCMLFYKGCLGPKSLNDRLYPTGQEIVQVLREVRVPCYTWYFDRAYQYSFNPSREAWMRNVAPLCRVAFVTDGTLARTDWARWHLLRQGVSAATVEPVDVPENERRGIGFLGQIYGDRVDELRRVTEKYPVHVITGVFGRALNKAVRSHKIILGPRFPSVPGYWSNRIYVVLGHGGFFLTPEIEGMSEEGFVPGVHYAPLGDDPVDDIRYWLDRPAERERIAKAGQQLVLSRFTYEHRAKELARVIAETLSDGMEKETATTICRATRRASVRPAVAATSARNERVAVAVVNYNTAEHVSHLLFSLFRVLGREPLARVVVVDNGSTDASRPILNAMKNAGLIHAIFNETQQYHGPALNQAVDYLAARMRSTDAPEDSFDHVWILDSDTIVLRTAAVPDALARMNETDAGILGEFQYDALPEGYVHPSSMLVDLRRTFLPGIGRFDESGAPAAEMHRRLRAQGIPICDFPVRSKNYVLHLGRSTLRAIRARNESSNRHYTRSLTYFEPHYHGNSAGAKIHEDFAKLFTTEVPHFSAKQLVTACLKTGLLEVPLPDRSDRYTHSRRPNDGPQTLVGESR